MFSEYVCQNKEILELRFKERSDLSTFIVDKLHRLFKNYYEYKEERGERYPPFSFLAHSQLVCSSCEETYDMMLILLPEPLMLAKEVINMNLNKVDLLLTCSCSFKLMENIFMIAKDILFDIKCGCQRHKFLVGWIPIKIRNCDFKIAAKEYINRYQILRMKSNVTNEINFDFEEDVSRTMHIL